MHNSVAAGLRLVITPSWAVEGLLVLTCPPAPLCDSPICCGIIERSCNLWLLDLLVRGKDVQARSEDIDAFAVVGEVGTFIAEGGGTNSDCFC